MTLLKNTRQQEIDLTRTPGVERAPDFSEAPGGSKIWSVYLREIVGAAGKTVGTF